MKYLFVFILYITPFLCIGQTKISKELEIVKNALSPAKPQLFNISSARSNVIVPDEIQEYSLLQINQNVLRDLKSQRLPYLQLTIPQSGRNSIVLELVESDLFTADFSVIAAPLMHKVEYKSIKHYHGIIQGQDRSYAAISILDDELIGIISHPAASGSLVIGKLEDSDDHIMYQDHQIAAQNSFSCLTDDNTEIRYNQDQLRFRKPAQRNGEKCVGMYLEVDYDIYQNKGNNIDNTVAYITSLMNQVILLYQNEQIEAKISEIVVWTQPSPYNGASSMDMLNAFRSQRPNFNGDIAQLLSFKTNGGVAYVNTLCSSDKSYRTSFSRIQPTFQNVPTYSWSVHVVAHEFGHILGSHHTHACVWNGNNTAIDGCFTTEGFCSNPGIPQEGGTIMSYCHISSAGINFSNGFGTQPGNLLRSNIHNATCLSTCDSSGGNEDTCNGITLKVEIKTDAYPSETLWEIKNDKEIVVSSGGAYSSRHTVYNHDICLPAGCYSFQIQDRYGDGICCNYGQGHYLMKIDNEIIFQGGQFNDKENQSFCLHQDVPTCEDGIQNGDEEGIDCGGSCAPCPTCEDGIQNGDEEGIDCGGGCTPCPTCEDGIQNGDEDGIDCGGSCIPCDTQYSGIVIDTLAGYFFETDWDGWYRGGTHATRVRSIHSPEGNFSLRIRNGAGELSSVFSPEWSSLDYDYTLISFSFKCVGMEIGKGFKLQAEKNGIWFDIKEYNISSSTLNNTTYLDSIRLDSEINGLTKIRFQNLGSDNSDLTYIDAVQVIGVKSGAEIPNCQDGIQNGEETGIDCGGNCPPCDSGEGDDESSDDDDNSIISTTEMAGYYFEESMDGWLRGGTHANRVYSIHSPEGQYSLRLRNGQGEASSVMSPLVTFENVDSIRIDFASKAVSYETGKSFIMSYFNGEIWQDVKEWVSGIDFTTNQSNQSSVVIPVGSIPYFQIKLTSQGSDNSDLIYLDAFSFTAFHKENDVPSMHVANVYPLVEVTQEKPILMPNPADSFVDVLFEEIPKKIQLFDLSGQLMEEFFDTQQIFIENFPSGIYMAVIHTTDNVFNLKLVKR